jgi:hypothetical protein
MDQAGAALQAPSRRKAGCFNDGLAQEWFDHPGYFTILLLGCGFAPRTASGFWTGTRFPARRRAAGLDHGGAGRTHDVADACRRLR